MSKEFPLEKLRDPKFYLENLCKVKIKKGGLGRFILKECQKDLFNSIKNFNRTIILKARQLGFSTAVTGWIYHNTIMNPGITSALIGYNSTMTAELLDKIKTFYKTTPLELRPTIHYNSKYEISFPKIDSKIIVLPSTESVGRGYTLNNCLVTELSSWEKAEEKMMTLEASVPINGNLIIESTPRGQGNLYHRMWMSDDNGYDKRAYGWWWGYTQEEIDMIKKRMNNPQKFAQEYGLEFLASGRSVFDQGIIKKQRKNILKIGDCIKLKDGNKHFVKEEDDLTIYVPPEVGKLYVCGVDVAEGVQGGDYSVATIFDRMTGEEVASFRSNKLAPDLFGAKLNKWGRKYNNALMVVEINNHGLTTLTILKQLIYPSLYFRQEKIERISQSHGDKMGWKTTKVTKPRLIDDLAQAFRDDVLIIHSKKLLDEMSVFVYDDGGNMTPQSGFHDDFIFAAGIGYQGFKVLYDKPLEQIDTSKHTHINYAS